MSDKCCQTVLWCARGCLVLSNCGVVWVSRNVGLRCGVCVLCCQTWCGVGVS